MHQTHFFSPEYNDIRYTGIPQLAHFFKVLGQTEAYAANSDRVKYSLAFSTDIVFRSQPNHYFEVRLSLICSFIYQSLLSAKLIL